MLRIGHKTGELSATHYQLWVVRSSSKVKKDFKMLKSAT